MNLPNSHFQDFPIEFKEINPIDFKQKDSFGLNKNGFEIENNREKIIIEPDEKGYINEQVQKFILINHKNTVVINAAVGQGKSYAIIQTIKRYYNENEDYLIIVASPFVSLVKQYCTDIEKDAEIPENQIYNYENLGRKPFVNYIGSKVQVLTVNTLLGNPGEDGFKNSDIKREYINNLINHCKVNSIKVVFIYDEIHDAIHNFKEEYIFNLWKWRDVIHKNFIISATFNEASKIVIEYLAELTDRKIKIIESKRVLFPKKQSDLYLHYNSAWHYNYNDPDIELLIKDLLFQDKEIDILCYSKVLAENLIKQKDSLISKLLKKKYGKENINNCTSDLVSNQRPKNEEQKNRYENNKCNIGTNFKTGVSIKKDNHAYVIIMPPKGTRLWFKNKYGIFSNGINSIIQAIARQRIKGEIHIILPKPDKFDFTSLTYSGMNESQINEFSEGYKVIEAYEVPEQKSRYFPLNIQNLLMSNFYLEQLEANVKEEINHIEEIDRVNFTRLEYPSYELFKLEQGEDYLANKFSFFGDDLSSYVTYCAFTNQFVNCNLKGITYKSVILLKENEIQKGLHEFFRQKLGDDYYYSRMEGYNDNLCLKEFRDELFNNYTIKFQNTKKDKWLSVKSGSNKLVEKQIIRFVSNLKYGKSSYFIEDFKYSLEDLDYDRSKYFLSCIAHSKETTIIDSILTEDSTRIVKAFQNLIYFREKLISNITHYNRGGAEYYYLPVKPFENFITSIEDVTRVHETINSLVECDKMISNSVFEYKSIITKMQTQEQQINSFYKKLLEDFFNLEKGPKKIKIIRNSVVRINVRVIESIKILPPSDRVFNFVANPDYFSSDFTSNNSTQLNEVMIKAIQEFSS